MACVLHETLRLCLRPVRVWRRCGADERGEVQQRISPRHDARVIAPVFAAGRVTDGIDRSAFERGHKPGHDERRFAAAGRAKHRQKASLTEPLEYLLDQFLPAEELVLRLFTK